MGCTKHLKHFNWITDTPCPYCRIDELEQQLAERDAEIAEYKSHIEILNPEAIMEAEGKYLDEIELLQQENAALRAEVERLKEENSHLWVRVESGEAAAYEQGKAEARKQAAQEIADWLRDDIYSIESRYLQNSEYKAILFFVSNELRQRYGLKG